MVQMGFPNDSLLSLYKQEAYMVVQDYISDPASLAYNSCKEGHDDELHGFTVSVIYQRKNTILAQAKYYTYNIRSIDGEYNTNFTRVIEDDIQITSKGDTSLGQTAVQIALYYAFRPVERPSSVQQLLDLQYQHLTDPRPESVAVLAESRKKVIYHMMDIAFSDSSYLSGKFNEIDRQHVPLAISSVKIDELDTNTYIKYYIHSAHVNIVHNCKQICSQAVLGEARSFIATQDIQQYGLLCTRRLLGLRAAQEAQKGVCTECKMYSMIPLATSAAIALGSIVSIFLRYSNSACAKAIRLCCACTADTTRGAQRVNAEKAKGMNMHSVDTSEVLLRS